MGLTTHLLVWARVGMHWCVYRLRWALASLDVGLFWHHLVLCWSWNRLEESWYLHGVGCTWAGHGLRSARH
jgi:hypothetical protein